ncbi:MAG: hypothetical protein ACXW3P_10190 [Rhodospirillales bacterium]
MEVVRIGSWITRRRRALGAFALANDVGKYAVLAPALLATHPAIAPVQVLGSAAPHTAILSTIIFNALAVFFSLSFALYSPTGTPRGGAEGLSGRVVVFAVAGFLAPILSIPLIERALMALHLASSS